TVALNAEPAARSLQDGAPAAVRPLPEPEHATGRGCLSRESIGQVPVLFGEDIYGESLGHGVGKAAVLVDQPENVRRLTVGYEQRRYRKTDPVPPCSCGPDRDRPGEPPPKAAHRVTVALRRDKRVILMDRHSDSLLCAGLARV